MLIAAWEVLIFLKDSGLSVSLAGFTPCSRPDRILELTVISWVDISVSMYLRR